MSTPTSRRCRKRFCRCPMSCFSRISAALRQRHGAPWVNWYWTISRRISVTGPCLPRSDKCRRCRTRPVPLQCLSALTRILIMPVALRWITTLFITLTRPAALAQNQPGFRTETVAEGIPVPWGMTWLPDVDMLVTERSGRLYRVHAGQLTTIGGPPEIHVTGQGGLLDIAAHPDYANNGWLYLSYASPDGSGDGSHTAIMLAQLQDGRLINHQVLYKAEPNSTRGQHYGSRIQFDRDGYLFFSIGDRG